MKKTAALALILIAVGFAACKQGTTPYCYKLYEFEMRYPASGTPADSFAYVDTMSRYCFGEFRGDTIPIGTVSAWTLNGPYYYKGTSYEVFIR